MSSILLVFQIVVFIYSAIIHEYMHGWMAERLGDSTAKDMGRLTLNPIPHIDPYGSIFLPLMLIMMNAGFLFGWAKPVPYNPYNLSDQKYGGAKVAIAGPLGNFIMALFFGLVLRLVVMDVLVTNQIATTLLGTIVYINLILMVFNLLPIPPLDGSKILMPFLPYNLQIRYASLERYGIFLVLFFVIFAFPMIIPVIDFLFFIITGA